MSFTINKKHSTRIYFIIFILSVILIYHYHNTQNYPVSSQGFHDLSHWDFQNDGNVYLNSDWEFYANHLFEPASFIYEKEPSDYITLPGYWNIKPEENKTPSGKGYATFRLLVKTSEYGNTMGVLLREVPSAYTLWVNGEIILSMGKTGRNSSDEEPHLSFSMAEFNPQKPILELILQISNFHNLKGGLKYPIILGLKDNIEKEATRTWTKTRITASGLFILGLVHIGIFFFQIKNPSPLYLAAVSMLISVHFMASHYGGWFVQVQFPGLPWSYIYRLELISLVMIFPFLLKFSESMFPDETKKEILLLSVSMATIFTLTALFVGFQNIRTAMAIYFFLALFFIFSILVFSYRAVIKKRKGAFVVLTGSMFILTAVFNDVLHDLQMITTKRVLSDTIFITVTLISITTLIRLFKTLKESDTKLILQTQKLESLKS